MSLEETLTRNAAAVEALTKAVETLAKFAQTLQGPLETAIAKDTETQQTTTAAPARRGRPAGVAAAKASPGPANTPETDSLSTAAAEPIKYDAVREAVVRLAEVKGHPAALAVVTKFGVDSAKKLRPDQYAECLSLVAAAMNAPVAASLA